MIQKNTVCDWFKENVKLHWEQRNIYVAKSDFTETNTEEGSKKKSE